MSEKPQAAREDDLLEQVFTQGLEKMSVPAQTADAVEAPKDKALAVLKQESGGEASSDDDSRNRRSSVYLYLLVLFGAAFLMLLLAYFIQRRSNEYTISDLQDSMNLSRQELLAEINRLNGRINSLTDENERIKDSWASLNNELTQLQERYDEQVLDANNLLEQYYAASQSSYAWQTFWILEQSFQSGDYESCAALLLLIAQRQYAYYPTSPDSVRDHYVEIVQAVIDEGILDQSYQSHISDYEELIDAYLAEHEEVAIYN